MRYSQEHKAETRARLVRASARVAKRKGFAAASVDTLMKAAGLSGGGFYKHFRGKADLLRAIVEQELARSRGLLQPRPEESPQAWRRRAVEAYFAPDNVTVPETACMLPALASEIARSAPATRRCFESGLQQMVAAVAPEVGGDAAAWSVLAQMVGGVMIARALPPGATRDAVICACRDALLAAGAP